MYWILALVLATIIFLLWIYFGTRYNVSNKEGLTYRSGPIHGKIKADRIKEIVRGKTLWSGLKPALSRKGLIIRYDTYNEIYVKDS